MKRALSVLIIFGLVAMFVGTLVFLYRKSQAKPVSHEVVAPMTTDIVRKTVATGNIVPRNEVDLKPRVSGIVDRIAVEPGQSVRHGGLIATIQIVPNTVRLTQAQAAVKSARISAKNAQNEFVRATGLRADGIMSLAEFNRYKLEQELGQERLAAAIDEVRVIRNGASRAAGNDKNTEVRSTVAGMVLEVPVEEGMSVIESNTFNAGTTIATVADMNDLIFQGLVDESEVGKIKEGMRLEVIVGAIENLRFDGTLEYIAPKGRAEDGTIQFEIKAAIAPSKDVMLRAGYSANANIVLESVQNVLAIKESVLHFDGDIPYVHVQIGPQQFERRDVKIGLSDGIHIEIKSGIDKSAKLKGRRKDG